MLGSKSKWVESLKSLAPRIVRRYQEKDENRVVLESEARPGEGKMGRGEISHSN